MKRDFGFRISDFGFQSSQSAIRNPQSAIVRTLCLILACASHLFAAGDWWNPAWSHRKRVRVRLAPCEPLGFRYRPPAAGAEDTMAAEALIPCEVKLSAPAQREVRVLDSGGNVLPCAAAEPDARGLVRVTFPARRTIAGQLASPIQNGTATVTLSVGRDKAVAPRTRFYALAGGVRIATLEVQAVQDKASTARVLEKSTPNIAQGVPVESEVLASADYFIYYGNPKPEGEAPRWTASVPPVAMYGWRVTDGALLNLLEEARGTYRLIPVDRLRAAMRSSPTYVGSHSLSSISGPGNPLGYDADYHVSVYESFFRCDLPGLYRFSVDSSAPAYLFIDGKMMAQRASFFYQVAGNFEHRGKIELAEGYHHLLFCAVETAKAHLTRLGWQPINATVFTPVPPSFFLTRVGAEVVGFETRDGGPQLCLSYKLGPLSVVAEKGKRFQFVRFLALPPAGGDDAAAYRWTFGDGSQGAGPAPGHLYEVASADGAAPFNVTLEATRDGKPFAQYTQVAVCEPRPSEKLNLSLEIVSFANIVYYDERTSIAVRLRNAAFSPVVVRAIARLETRDDKQIIVNQDIPIEGKNENFCVIPLDMKALEDKTALIELDILIGGQRVLDAAARVVPFNGLTRRGVPAIEGGQLILGPGGPYTGVAYAGADFPTMNYEVVLHAQRRAGRELPCLTFPVGSALCTLRPRAWDIAFEQGRWYALRLRVSEGRVEAWLDDRKVTDIPRAAAQNTLPLAFDAMKPFGLHTSLNTQAAVRDVALTRLSPATPPGGKSEIRNPKSEILFAGSLEGWKPAAECDLNTLQRGLGSLHDGDGRRIMLSAETEDPERHLKWVFIRAGRELFANRTRVLLFGDRMANPTLPGKAFADYVTALEERLTKAKRPFQFVERHSGLLPTLADVALFAQSIQLVKPPPHIVVLSPGLADVQQAVGDRDFTRSFDLMIDAVRSVSDSIKILIVSPPPCPRNVRVSRLYNEGVEKLAREHHVDFLDLDTLLAKGQDDWLDSVYAAPDAKGIYLDNPNEAAHRRIADAIEKLIQP